MALQQHAHSGSNRSTVGSLTTLSNALRMLYSRAGDYPPEQPIIYADGFSSNTPQGACPTCEGLGQVYDVTEAQAVPDPSKTIAEGAIEAWPGAWQGKNLIRVLVALGYDVNIPWQQLPESERNWILFTDDAPVVPVFRSYTLEESVAALARGEEPAYKGKFVSVRRFILDTFTGSQSERTRARVARYLSVAACPLCEGKKLTRQALSVTFAGKDIAALCAMSFDDIAVRLGKVTQDCSAWRADRALVATRIISDIEKRISTLQALGLGYLSPDRTIPTLSHGEFQRLRLATQLRSQLFGVVYVLDEPSAGLHPHDTQALSGILRALVEAGNSVFMVEHNPAVIRQADWLVDIGPDAGEHGGTVVYNGPVNGLKEVTGSHTAQALFTASQPEPTPRPVRHWLQLQNVQHNTLRGVDVAFPVGVMSAVTGLSGAGKSSLVSQALSLLVRGALGYKVHDDDEAGLAQPDLQSTPAARGFISSGLEHFQRQVNVNQKPIGRTPRSNLATYVGMFTAIRKLFAATSQARQAGLDAGDFSFNLPKGRCPHCEGVGFVSVELLFMPSIYAPCPQCHGQRYTPDILAISYQSLSIAQVLDLTVDQALDFFAGETGICHSLNTLAQVGLGYLKLGQPATELSGGEAQRIKLASELQRGQQGHTLYILDEPTTGLHPADSERLMTQLHRLVDAGNTVVLVEHNTRVIAGCDWVIDMGPGAGDKGGKIIAQGTPQEISQLPDNLTGQYLKVYF